jgi:RNA polymerase sigma-70 factor (ECF subfamily)
MENRAQMQIDSDHRVHDAWITHHERLWRSLLAWSGDREIASDAVAEAFAQATRRGAAVDDVGRWVWRAAFRIAGGLLADGRRNGGTNPTFSDPADLATLPDDAAALIDALDRLRPTDRRIVVLSIVGGWSAADIGRLVDITPGTVRVRLHRAKARLRTILEDHDA